ncbi:hypothetical protein SDC9_72460 [bioreactor metagenome]|uniref:Uncharacterized protein n=1 Tax=bioreactor metagenome TaxID=1076179 RepID=A0A644YCD9_9ZZZZ
MLFKLGGIHCAAFVPEVLARDLLRHERCNEGDNYRGHNHQVPVHQRVNGTGDVHSLGGGFGDARKKCVSSGNEEVCGETSLRSGISCRDTYPRVAPQGLEYGRTDHGREDDARVGRKVRVDSDDGKGKGHKIGRRPENGFPHEGGDHSGLFQETNAQCHYDDQAERGKAGINLQKISEYDPHALEGKEVHYRDDRLFRLGSSPSGSHVLDRHARVAEPPGQGQYDA